MNARTLRTLGIACAAAAVAIACAATARADELIAVKVPFAFIVGDTRLPAGNYVVTKTSGGAGVLAIRSTDGEVFSQTLTIVGSSDASPARPKLIFEKLSHQYFLARVVPRDGDERDVVLTPSIMAREIARTADRPSN